MDIFDTEVERTSRRAHPSLSSSSSTSNTNYSTSDAPLPSGLVSSGLLESPLSRKHFIFKKDGSGRDNQAPSEEPRLAAACSDRTNPTSSSDAHSLRIFQELGISGSRYPSSNKVHEAIGTPTDSISPSSNTTESYISEVDAIFLQYNEPPGSSVPDQSPCRPNHPFQGDLPDEGKERAAKDAPSSASSAGYSRVNSTSKDSVFTPQEYLLCFSPGQDRSIRRGDHIDGQWSSNSGRFGNEDLLSTGRFGLSSHADTGDQTAECISDDSARFEGHLSTAYLSSPCAVVGPPPSEATVENDIDGSGDQREAFSSYSLIELAPPGAQLQSTTGSTGPTLGSPFAAFDSSRQEDESSWFSQRDGEEIVQGLGLDCQGGGLRAGRVPASFACFGPDVPFHQAELERRVRTIQLEQEGDWHFHDHGGYGAHQKGPFPPEIVLAWIAPRTLPNGTMIPHHKCYMDRALATANGFPLIDESSADTSAEVTADSSPRNQPSGSPRSAKGSNRAVKRAEAARLQKSKKAEAELQRIKEEKKKAEKRKAVSMEKEKEREEEAAKKAERESRAKLAEKSKKAQSKKERKEQRKKEAESTEQARGEVVFAEEELGTIAEIQARTSTTLQDLISVFEPPSASSRPTFNITEPQLEAEKGVELGSDAQTSFSRTAEECSTLEVGGSRRGSWVHFELIDGLGVVETSQLEIRVDLEAASHPITPSQDAASVVSPSVQPSALQGTESFLLDLPPQQDNLNAFSMDHSPLSSPSRSPDPQSARRVNISIPTSGAGRRNSAHGRPRASSSPDIRELEFCSLAPSQSSNETRRDSIQVENLGGELTGAPLLKRLPDLTHVLFSFSYLPV